jgi:DUSP domain.
LKNHLLETTNQYVVFQEWINAWKNFVYTNNRFLRRNFIKGHAPPGPVENAPLLDANGNPKPNLIKNTHYRMVNEYIWKIFVELYGGGPTIPRVGKDIYTGIVEKEISSVRSIQLNSEPIGQIVRR